MTLVWFEIFKEWKIKPQAFLFCYHGNWHMFCTNLPKSRTNRMNIANDIFEDHQFIKHEISANLSVTRNYERHRRRVKTCLVDVINTHYF